MSNANNEKRGQHAKTTQQLTRDDDSVGRSHKHSNESQSTMHRHQHRTIFDGFDLSSKVEASQILQHPHLRIDLSLNHTLHLVEVVETSSAVLLHETDDLFVGIVDTLLRHVQPPSDIATHFGNGGGCGAGEHGRRSSPHQHILKTHIAKALEHHQILIVDLEHRLPVVLASLHREALTQTLTGSSRHHIHCLVCLFVQTKHGQRSEPAKQHTQHVSKVVVVLQLAVEIVVLWLGPRHVLWRRAVFSRQIHRHAVTAHLVVPEVSVETHQRVHKAVTAEPRPLLAIRHLLSHQLVTVGVSRKERLSFAPIKRQCAPFLHVIV